MWSNFKKTNAEDVKMKVLLVNLAKNPERLAVADAQLKKQSVIYERFAAVYGKELSAEEQKKAVNTFRWWCAIGRPVVPAEIGCALSHYRIYQRMIAEDLPYVCILEDDVVITEHFLKQLENIAQWLDVSQSQVVLLSNHTSQRGEDWDILSTKSDMWTEGYVLTQKAAKALLRANLPMQVPCDHWRRWVNSGAIKLYHAFPTVCSQDQVTFASSTSEGRRLATNERALLSYVLHKVKRCIGKLIDCLLCYLEKMKDK